MKVLIFSGSRADLGILHYPTERMRADPFFQVEAIQMPQQERFDGAFDFSDGILYGLKPVLLFILGDRWEIMAAATAAHLQRIPIAHIGGGDVTEGSYDDAMRDCISRMAAIHFTTSTAATARLVAQGYRNVNLVGNPAVDYIMHAAWQREGGWPTEPYLLVSYQAETIDSDHHGAGFRTLKLGVGKRVVFIRPNKDLGSDTINIFINDAVRDGDIVHDYVSHDEFLNLLYHCDEFIGNSSAIFYEAPFLKPGGVPCRLIGKRQRGRVIPWGGGGKASERIVDALKRWTP